jgi:ATP-dependent Clp protease protease subunit
MMKAREFCARVQSPVGKPFAAAKKAEAAELYLYDLIGADLFETGISAPAVVAALAEMKGAKRLDIHINSPGGQVFEGLAIYNAIRSFEGVKTAYVDGVAASIASVIALAADRVVTSDAALWMIHEPMGGVMSMGTADEIEADAAKTVKGLRKVRETMTDIYMTATGQPLAKVSAWLSAETWMTAAESLEFGFSDEVLTQEPPAEEKPAATLAAPAFAVATPPPPAAAAEWARARVKALSEKYPGPAPAVGQPTTNAAKTQKGKTP